MNERDFLILMAFSVHIGHFLMQLAFRTVPFLHVGHVCGKFTVHLVGRSMKIQLSGQVAVKQLN